MENLFNDYEPIPFEKRLDPRLLGSATTLEPNASTNSSSRAAMRATFLTQMLVLEGATPRRIVTGAEREYGKYTMRVEVPCRCKVLKIIRKYPRRLGLYEFKQNSETTIIYESLENGEMGSIIVPNFHWNHKVFGFKYVHNPILKTLGKGSILEKGTVLADSPSIKPNGDYAYGIETAVAFMSVPGIVEDGVIASDEYCQRIASTGFGSATLEWGVDSFPLNLYGDDDDYKAFPDIGERIRSDGVLYALREYDPVMAVCNMSKDALKEIDHTFDRVHYVELSSMEYSDPPVIEEVNVYHSHNPDLWKTPPTMEKQVRRYHEATKIYNTEIYNSYNDELVRRRNVLTTSNQFHAQVVRCMIGDNNIPKISLPKSTTRIYRRTKLNDWWVELKYSWRIVPGVKSKLSDCFGGKGVICAVWPKERMPVDDNGNRFDLIFDGISTLRRTNFGRFNEHYITATMMKLEKELKSLVEQGDTERALYRLFAFYKAASPNFYQKSQEILTTPELKHQHLMEVVQEGLRLWLPQDTPKPADKMMQDIREGIASEFPTEATPVTYIDDNGVTRRTVKEVLYGSLYILVLEKIGDDWGATSIPKRQHHGIPSKLTDHDKHTLPWRSQAFKIFGEAEVRLALGTLNPTFVSSLLTLPNSPEMCVDAAKNILRAKEPTNIRTIVDYRKHAEKPGRALQYFNHMLSVSGVKIVKGKEDR